VPRTLADSLLILSAGLQDRMHSLLERNTDGELSADEKSELTALVHVAEFEQIVLAAVKTEAHQ
jgi:hypothetical protein